MHALARNPINRRLRRASRWPSEVSARWIGGGVGLLVGLASVTITVRVSTADDWSIVLGAELMFLIGCLTVCFVLSATLMASYVQTGDTTLMRLSNMPAATLVDGYTGGILYRMRLARAIAVWSPLGWAVALMVTFLPSQVGYLLCGIGNAMLIGGVVVGAQVMLKSFTTLIVSAGVWVGLRLGRHAGVMAAGVGALAGAATMVLVGVVFTPGLCRCCGPVIVVAALTILDSRRDFFRDDAIWRIEAGALPGMPPTDLL